MDTGFGGEISLVFKVDGRFGFPVRAVDGEICYVPRAKRYTTLSIVGVVPTARCLLLRFCL